MQLQGEQSFEASPETVWDAVLRPEVLEACIPGAQSVNQTADTVYEGTIKRGVAAVTVEMSITVEITEDNQPDQVVVSIEGSDNRINSSVDGEALIEITETNGESVLNYTADLNFTGKLASLGARLIKRQMNNDLKKFFSNLEEYISEQATAD